MAEVTVVQRVNVEQERVGYREFALKGPWAPSVMMMMMIPKLFSCQTK